MSEPVEKWNSHDHHNMQEPWQSHERVKHDLREAKALFEIYKPLGGDLKKIYTLVCRALDRVDW